jgi:hypothetical protein
MKIALPFFYNTNLALAIALFLIMSVDKNRTSAKQAGKKNKNRGQERGKEHFTLNFKVRTRRSTKYIDTQMTRMNG